MNKARRKRISDISKQLEALKIQISELESLKSEIDDLQSEEQESYDSLPESLQQAEKGQSMDRAIESLGSAAEEIEGFISDSDATLDEVLTALGAAAE